MRHRVLNRLENQLKPLQNLRQNRRQNRLKSQLSRSIRWPLASLARWYASSRVAWSYCAGVSVSPASSRECSSCRSFFCQSDGSRCRRICSWWSRCEGARDGRSVPSPQRWRKEPGERALSGVAGVVPLEGSSGGSWLLGGGPGLWRRGLVCAGAIEPRCECARRTGSLRTGSLGSKKVSLVIFATGLSVSGPDE